MNRNFYYEALKQLTKDHVEFCKKHQVCNECKYIHMEECRLAFVAEKLAQHSHVPNTRNENEPKQQSEETLYHLDKNKINYVNDLIKANRKYRKLKKVLYYIIQALLICGALVYGTFINSQLLQIIYFLAIIFSIVSYLKFTKFINRAIEGKQVDQTIQKHNELMKICDLSLDKIIRKYSKK